MTLDELILHCNGCKRTGFNRTTAKLLQELKNRRESDLRPCDKFLKAYSNEQFSHIEQEFKEVKYALHDVYSVGEHINGKEKEHLAEELVDLQMSCETMLAILGLGEQQRRDVRKKVIEKNRKRGYYKGANDNE